MLLDGIAHTGKTSLKIQNNGGTDGIAYKGTYYLAQDNQYGVATYDTVKNFQSNVGKIKNDGILGAQTWQSLCSAAKTYGVSSGPALNFNGKILPSTQAAAYTGACVTSSGGAAQGVTTKKNCTQGQTASACTCVSPLVVVGTVCTTKPANAKANCTAPGSTTSSCTCASPMVVQGSLCETPTPKISSVSFSSKNGGTNNWMTVSWGNSSSFYYAVYVKPTGGGTGYSGVVGKTGTAGFSAGGSGVAAGQRGQVVVAACTKSALNSCGTTSAAVVYSSVPAQVTNLRVIDKFTDPHASSTSDMILGWTAANATSCKLYQGTTLEHTFSASVLSTGQSLTSQGVSVSYAKGVAVKYTVNCYSMSGVTPAYNGQTITVTP